MIQPPGPNGALTRRGLQLEYATLGWNVVGVVLVLLSAYHARSVALASFGIDSLIEIFASVVVIWQLKSIKKDQEQRAERLIGVAFLLLAAYIAAQATVVLAADFHPGTSPLGIAWLAATTVAMFLLAWGKGQTGRALGNPVLLKESRVTIVDGILAVSVLVGITLNALFGAWWADPLAGFIIMFYGVREGVEALRLRAGSA